MMRTAISAMIMALFPVFLSAQMQEDRNRSGSVYSSIAFGEPVELFSPGGAGMGVRGVSLYDPYSVNSANPGLWGVSGHTQGVITFDMHRYNVEDGAQTAVNNHVGINRFQLVLPVVRNRLGVSAGFIPLTRSRYSLTREGTFTPDFEPIDYTDIEVGTGGVNRAELGVGYRLTDHVSLGYAFGYYFASLNREHDIEFDSARYLNHHYNEDLSGNGISHRVGLFGRRGDLFRDGDEASLGVSVSLPTNIEMTRSLTSFRSIRGQPTQVDLLPGGDNRGGEIDLPLEFNVGLTYNPSRIVSVTAEYLVQQWGEASYSYSAVEEQYLADRSKITTGLQFHPYRLDGAGGFFSSFRYNLGASHDTGHLNIDGNRVETLSLHGGIGILSSRTASSIDLGFELGFRGNGATNQIQETIWGVTLTLNLAEYMFVPPRFQ